MKPHENMLEFLWRLADLFLAGADHAHSGCKVTHGSPVLFDPPEANVICIQGVENFRSGKESEKGSAFDYFG